MQQFGDVAAQHLVLRASRERADQFGQFFATPGCGHSRTMREPAGFAKLGRLETVY